MKRIFKYLKSKKGITLVLMAFMLALLLMLAGLAIDIAYMYYVKNQLQVAADASALAGAAELAGGTNVLQTPAREQAWKFACENKAAGSSVYLVADGTDCSTFPGNLNNGNNSTGDIVVGFWDSANRTFTPGDGSTVQINAVKVVASRTGEAAEAGIKNGGNQVRVFIGQIFSFLGGKGWPFMSARASAIASRPPRAMASVAICTRTCDEWGTPMMPPPPVTLYWTPYPSEIDPGNQGIAWTVFSETLPSTPTNELIPYFCGKEKDACNLIVYSDNGYKNEVARQFRCAFKNPLYDSEYKTCADGKCNSSSDTVISWTVLAPVFESAGCPPGKQNPPAQYKIERYVELTITEVYASGGGGTNECACGAYDVPAMTGPTPNAIVVSAINCVACPATELLGRKPVLVK